MVLPLVSKGPWVPTNFPKDQRAAKRDIVVNVCLFTAFLLILQLTLPIPHTVKLYKNKYNIFEKTVCFLKLRILVAEEQ